MLEGLGLVVVGGWMLLSVGRDVGMVLASCIDAERQESRRESGGVVCRGHGGL